MMHRARAAVFAGLAIGVGFSASPCVAQSVDQGVELMKERKYAEAKAVLLPLGDRDAVAAFHLGQIMMESNEDGKAAEWFEKAVKMNPRSAIYHDWLGRSYGRQAQRANKLKQPFLARKTKNAWETALTLDPESIEVRENLIAYYTRAPGFLGGSKEKARAMALEIKKRNAFRGGIAVANLCSAEKDNACIEREFNELQTSYPDSPSVYVSMAAHYANQGQSGNSFAVLDKALREKPNEPVFLYQVGRTASISGKQLDRGEDALKRYIASPSERGPAPANAHYRLGLVYEKKGSKDQARAEYETALRLNPRLENAKKALSSLGK